MFIFFIAVMVWIAALMATSLIFTVRMLYWEEQNFKKKILTILSGVMVSGVLSSVVLAPVLFPTGPHFYTEETQCS